MKKIIIFGCQKITVDVIKFLKKKKIEIPLVITSPLPLDKIYGYVDVLSFCKKNNIKCISSSPNDRLLYKLKKLNPDLILSIYYRKVFNKKYIQTFKKKIINFHPSFLPYYKGLSPTAWCLLNNEKQTGVTLHYCDEKIDSGEILAQEKFKILKNISGHKLFYFSMVKMLNLFKRNFVKILEKKIKLKKQKKIKSYYGRFRSVGLINWNKKIIDILNKVKVYTIPYSMVQFKVLNKIGFINKVSVRRNVKKGRPGEIIGLIGKKPIISCLNGSIIIDEYHFTPNLTKKEISYYFKKGNILKNLDNK